MYYVNLTSLGVETCEHCAVHRPSLIGHVSSFSSKFNWRNFGKPYPADTCSCVETEMS